MSDMSIIKQIKPKQLQKDQPNAEFEVDFEESQYGSSADSDGVCEEDKTLRKIDVDITSDDYNESVKRKKVRFVFLRQVYEQKVYSQHRLLHPLPIPPIIARAAGIPGTQEIVPIPPLWSAKVDPQREKDIQIELLDNEKKMSDYSQQKQQTPLLLSNYSLKPITKYRCANSTTRATAPQIGSLITNQPGFISKFPEYIQQPDSLLLPNKTKNSSIIPSVPGNIPATEYPASFVNVTPSIHHSLFVIPTPFRPPAPALFVVNSFNQTAATLYNFGLQRYIEEIPGVVLNIDRKKRELILADGSLIPYDLLIIAAELQEQTLKKLSQPIAENDFHLDVADGAITMKDEADAIRFQRFFHKPTQPGRKKWL
ncbi:MAG: hypothetical protein EZS28_009015 [Streblomastix strix]|uniref:FAD/NAD(P)-binding domain-containing protein n=1 Tax=Streblomastix strix TaxID=222440 RepID=A0A5J4WK78_9EUKA|nr:MAG: hypothetical protein EZS28_009015 [Streblomastix strix]